MEADGDKTTLQKWADKSKPEMKTVYERALNLNAAEKAMADTAKTFFKEKGEEAQKLGLLGNLLENYVTHFVEKAPANQRSGLMARILGDLASATPSSACSRACSIWNRKVTHCAAAATSRARSEPTRRRRTTRSRIGCS
jgi:hypothetical protein